MVDGKVQKGNPHQLTINQHVHPARSIERFADSAGTVEVWLRRNNKTFRAVPDNPLFCATRTWDQRAESGYMKSIEDEFQIVADRIANGGATLTVDESVAASRFFILWQIRAQQKHNPIGDTPVTGVAPDPLTKNQREQLEKIGGMFMNSDQMLSGRSVSGFQIFREIDRRLTRLRNANWGAVTADQGEFLLPESFGYCCQIPITPSRCLVYGHADLIIPESEVAKANRVALALDTDYLIARDLTKCPR
ncbi:MAG: hypothetical protein ABSB35_05970 [Bryobacteraceae bacterium]|jgi:hypothetical protein